MRIDAHHHVWQLSRGDYGWLTAEQMPQIYRDYAPQDLAPLLARCGIDKTVLVQCAPTEAETDFMLRIASETDFVAAVVGWTDLEAPDAPERVAALARKSYLKGLRPMLQDLEDDEWILRPALKPAIAAIEEAGLTFDILILPRHLPHIARFLAEHPQLKAVIDHGAKPAIVSGELESWAGWMRRIAKESDVFCKLSGLLTEAGTRTNVDALKPYVDVLLESFGPNRLLWGSDWPVLNLAGDYEGWFEMAQALTAQLTPRERDAVFGANAAGFYGIAP